MKTKQLALDIVKYTGGKQNIVQVMHCFTRIRIDLKDDSQAHTSKIKCLPDVLDVVSFGGQYQIIINTTAPNIYAHMSEILELEEEQ